MSPQTSVRPQDSSSLTRGAGNWGEPPGNFAISHAFTSMRDEKLIPEEEGGGQRDVLLETPVVAGQLRFLYQTIPFDCDELL